jgi:hypothetical protein
MECPHCHSDDVKRSRRTLFERLLLPILHAHAHRCCDCRKRFWTDVQWGPVILGFVTMTAMVGVIMAVMVAHQSRIRALSPAKNPVTAGYRVRRVRVPKRLPPLSQVPRPVDDSAPSKQ